MTDETLLRRWQAGEVEAGEALLARHFRSLYRFFRNKVGADCDDLIQDTMLACVGGAFRFEGRSTFKTYLLTIARNQLYQFVKRKHRGLELDPLHSSMEDLLPSPSEVAAANATRNRVHDALRRIALDLQIALELHYWDELTTAELAVVLDIPLGTVKSRLRRGREALARTLGDSELDDAALRSVAPEKTAPQ